MPTKTSKRNVGSDRGRVSAQAHEIKYAGSKLGKGGTTKVKKAKQALGRKTSRKAVMSKARKTAA
jgi:hypothetical protein